MISTNKKKMKQKMGYLSVAAAAGLFFASSFPLRFFWCGLLFVSGFLWLLYGKHRLSRCAVIVLLAAFTLSGSWYYGYTKLVYDPVISYAGQETTFTGIVTHQTIFNNDKASYQVKGTFPDGTSATILCYTNDYGCNYGDILTLSGTMEIPSSNYLFDGTAYYKANSIFLQANSDTIVTHTPTADYPLHRCTEQLRERLQKKILHFAGTTDGSIMIAMLFGQKQLLNDQIKQAFLRSGIGHVLSVSGFHMVVLLMPLAYLGRYRLTRFLRLLLTGGLIGLFALLTESPISILRAGLMVLLAQSGTIFYRKSSTGNALAIAFLVLALPQPYLIRDVSFLLSVSGTFGVGVFAPYLTRSLHPKTIFGRLGKQILSMALVFCCTLSVSSWFFSETSLLSPLTNVFLMPFCSLILICTVLTVLTGGVLATFFAGMAMVCCEWVTKAVLWLEKSLPLRFSNSGKTFPMLLLGLSLIVFLIWCYLPRKKLLCGLLCGQLAVLTVVQVGMLGLQRNTLFLSVLGRRAEAVVIVQYGNMVDVFDLTGHAKNPQYVQTYLQKHGISHIETLFLLQNVPQMEAAYDTTLSSVSCSAVLIPTDSFCRAEDTVCGQHPQQAERFKVSANTRNAYEIVWDSSALQVTCAGRTITISLKAYDTAIREAQQADFTLLSVHQEWMLTEQRGTELAALLQSDDIQIALSPQGQIRAKAL